MTIVHAKSPRFNSENVKAPKAGLDRLEREGALAIVDPQLERFFAYATELQQRLVAPAAVDLTYDIDLGRTYPNRDLSGTRDVVVSVRLGPECAQAIADCLVGKVSNDH